MSAPHKTACTAKAEPGLAPTDYLHGLGQASTKHTGQRDRPQVLPDDREIEVTTAWGQLLEVSSARARPLQGEAAEYGRGRLIAVEELFSTTECEVELWLEPSTATSSCHARLRHPCHLR